MKKCLSCMYHTHGNNKYYLLLIMQSRSFSAQGLNLRGRVLWRPGQHPLPSLLSEMSAPQGLSREHPSVIPFLLSPPNSTMTDPAAGISPSTRDLPTLPGSQVSPRAMLSQESEPQFLFTLLLARLPSSLSLSLTSLPGVFYPHSCTVTQSGD